MLYFLPSFILLPLNFFLFSFNLAICGSFIFVGGIIKLLLALFNLQHTIYQPMHKIYRFWALNNYLIINLTNKVDWQITENSALSKDSWYLIIANHQSWLDIMVLSSIALKRTPEPKYFLKSTLKRVPFLGMACWALDMPFMHRYSKSFIAKNPHLKGKDIESTQKSCQVFKRKPTAIINFVEGTRNTPEKKANKHSVFDNLLTPRAGGIAFTLASLGQNFEKILDISLVYPNNNNHIMMDVLTGKLTTVLVDINAIDIEPELIGDYDNDRKFRINFQRWLNDIWLNKDVKISAMKKAGSTLQEQQAIEKITNIS